ncbi:uncharacterized protein LOC107046077 [Diachasma alloeum]|uniref:uncharacterized protein LOC107046077 n=1 Tax=Diachasma alloeum TaxID=454923 RepID=UPI00073846EE|nr:uncharacterized protein LOC107046077 [Diachasma alloeum]
MGSYQIAIYQSQWIYNCLKGPEGLMIHQHSDEHALLEVHLAPEINVLVLLGTLIDETVDSRIERNLMGNSAGFKKRRKAEGTVGNGPYSSTTNDCRERATDPGRTCKLYDLPTSLNLSREYRLAGVVSYDATYDHSVAYCCRRTATWEYHDGLLSKVKSCERKSGDTT